ncbi:MAG: ZIP family metal transporter [Candidatus Moranbacteria bacterium]|nr:ZIP family metal transporter [Candidatus Moranbacteria bacterium]
MNLLFLILISCLLISSIAFILILILVQQQKIIRKIILYLVSISAGTFLGGAFLHLLPESSEKIENSLLFGIILVSIIFYFFLEKLIHWRHCHTRHCKEHSFGYINLIGDSIHNFIDGIIIASAFFIEPKIGLITALAIAMHEIPQEVGDFGVLIHAGFTKKKALILNTLVALTTALGGITGYFIGSQTENMVGYLIPFAAGGFIYISMSDLIPEIQKQSTLKKNILTFGLFLFGVLIMWLTTFFKI